MNFWIFVANNQPTTAEDAYNQRMAYGLWGIGENTPNSKNLERGDKAVFYLTTPFKAFAGTAIIEETDLTEGELVTLATEPVFLQTSQGVRFTAVERWEEPKSIIPLIDDLDFIKNKQAWGSFLQGGIKRISEDDFQTIRGMASHWIGVLTHHWAKDDLIEQARELLDRNGDAQSRAPGFVSRETFYSLNDPTQITTMVKWTSNEIYEEWRASPERAAVMTGADSLWSKHTVSERFQVAD